MSMLGLFNPDQQKAEGPRKLTQGILFGGGLAGASAVVLSVVQLVRANPDKGFMLLEKWGPWYFLAMFAVWALNGIAIRVLDVFAEVGDRFARSMDRIADEQVNLSQSSRDQADAMKRTADRDDREQERMSTLIEYSGQQSRQALLAVSSMQPVLQDIAAKLSTLATRKDG